MNKKLQQILTALIFTTSLFACNKPLFRPEQVHEPMLTQKGELSSHVSALVIAPYGAPTFDLGLGYSPFQHFSLKVAGRYRTKFNNENTSTSNTDTTTYKNTVNGSSLECGLGYYTQLTQITTFSIYGNIIAGRNIYKDYIKDLNVINDYLEYDYLSIGIQPSMIFARKKRFKMAAGLRLGLFQYKNIVTNNPQSGSTLTYQENEGRWNWVGEPFYNFEVGSRALRFFTQAGFAFASENIRDNDFPFNVKISVGLNVRLNTQINNHLP